MHTRLVLRMIAPIAVTSLFLLAVGGVAAWYVHSMQKDVSNLLAEEVASVRAAEELEISVLRMQTQLYQYLFTGDRRYLDEVPARRREIDQTSGGSLRVPS